jgi:multisubunit Na+/H+ antiporter MnhE subunit
MITIYCFLIAIFNLIVSQDKQLHGNFQLTFLATTLTLLSGCMSIQVSSTYIVNFYQDITEH